MNLDDLQVIVSPGLAPDEAWIVRRADAPELPNDLRGKVRVPCILTGNVKSLRDTLKLIRLTSGAAGPGAEAGRGGRGVSAHR